MKVSDFKRMRLLTPVEAVEAKNKPFHERLDKVLMKMAEENKVRVWLDKNGELYFQHNPIPIQKGAFDGFCW